MPRMAFVSGTDDLKSNSKSKSALNGSVGSLSVNFIEAKKLHVHDGEQGGVSLQTISSEQVRENSDLG